MAPRLDQDQSAVRWLLQSEDPSVRYFTLTEVLGRSKQSHEVRAARAQVAQGARLQALLAGQQDDGGFGLHPYRKWTGAHWRLVSAVELGVSNDNGTALKAADHVLKWIVRERPPKIEGLWRAHASVKGNALGVCSRLGLTDDPRVGYLAECLVEWQWPDGGWNCDSREDAQHSSFYESLCTLWGLTEYSKATGERESSNAAEKASEFFLRHRLFKSCQSDKIINPQWLKLHYPLYWHYDILQGLRILSIGGKLRDPRTKEALDILESKRMKDGRWRPSGYYWFPRKSAVIHEGISPGPSQEVVDWGRDGPNEMITLNALRVLKGSGQLKLPSQEL